jgi:adenylosuccinate lyase
VGTFEHLSPSVEEYVCEKLGLQPAPVSTQVIQRDRHAEYLTTLAIIGAFLEKIAVEVRHLQRTEVLEAEEYFSPGQKGSSAMPHKRNPIVSERICGLARLLRGNAMAAIENNALWHERDISHSSVERVICPDSTITIDYMLHLATGLVDRLVVYPENMQRNLQLTSGLPYSQSVMLALVRKGITREDAYRMVQRNAMRTWETRLPLRQTLAEDDELMVQISGDELDAIFDPNRMLKNVDTIFHRCGLSE